MLRASLKELLSTYDLTLPDKWQTLRPEALTPLDFVYLTKDLFGSVDNSESVDNTLDLMDLDFRKPDAVWRKSLDLYGKEKTNDLEDYIESNDDGDD
jgi:hypothetical protein